MSWSYPYLEFENEAYEQIMNMVEQYKSIRLKPTIHTPQPGKINSNCRLNHLCNEFGIDYL